MSPFHSLQLQLFKVLNQYCCLVHFGKPTLSNVFQSFLSFEYASIMCMFYLICIINEGTPTPTLHCLTATLQINNKTKDLHIFPDFKLIWQTSLKRLSQVLQMCHMLTKAKLIPTSKHSPLTSESQPSQFPCMNLQTSQKDDQFEGEADSETDDDDVNSFVNDTNTTTPQGT
jgi:hypothetical protein